MKKKLISSVVSVLCCLVVMAVGVYASTSHSFEISIANDMDVKIVAVDGTLFARRRGGVWATATESEAAYGNPITPATDFTDENDCKWQHDSNGQCQHYYWLLHWLYRFVAASG